MAKNGQKRVENFLGASRMINNNIFNIFSFSTFSLGYCTNPAFWLNFKKIALKTGSRKYPREKVEKLKSQISSNSKIPTSAIYPKPDSDFYW